MYFKLALKNVKKSYKDYFVYFITLTISVALFYVFNSFESIQQIIVADVDTIFALRTLTNAMSILSYFVTFVFGFLILYANNFIMKRRKKEIALYTLLGMKKSRVSRIMLYETLIVGIVSLFSGIVLGIIVSQGVSAFIGYLLKLTVEYRLIISTTAIISTLINFSLIFVIVGIFNNVIMSKTKLIDLFKARVSNEVVAVKQPVLMTVIMLISIAVIGYLYYFVMQPLQLLKHLLPVLIIGSLATFGLFYGLAFWFVELSQRLKAYYYRDLNAFTTRQISSKISSTYKLLASVSLMLLLSFGSLATAFNVNSIINKMFNQETMYDFNVEIVKEEGYEIEPVDYLNLEDVSEVNAYNLYQLPYLTSDLNAEDYHRVDGKSMLEDVGLGMALLNVEDYNYHMKREERETMSLNDNEIVYFINSAYLMNTDLEEQIFEDNIKLAGIDLSVKKHTDIKSNLGSPLDPSAVIIIANDQTINNILEASQEQTDLLNTTVVHKLININFKEGVDTEAKVEAIKADLDAYIKDDLEEMSSYYNYASKADNIKTARQTTLLLTFIGLYLGLTFIVVCVMVISLQLLSEASDNYERYLLLDKIGVDSKIQKKSIFKQNLIYFALPLIVALIHSFVGLAAVNDTMALEGLVTTDYTANFVGVGILAGIYLIYFIVTYFSSVRMIFDRK